MKEGVVDRIRVYYKLYEGIRKGEISKEEYDIEYEKWKKECGDDPFSFPEVEYDTKYVICLDVNDVYEICSLLDWDIKNNQMSLEKGTHPITGYKSGKHNQICIDRNKRWIKLLGGEVDEITE